MTWNSCSSQDLFSYYCYFLFSSVFLFGEFLYLHVCVTCDLCVGCVCVVRTMNITIVVKCLFSNIGLSKPAIFFRATFHIFGSYGWSVEIFLDIYQTQYTHTHTYNYSPSPQSTEKTMRATHEVFQSVRFFNNFIHSLIVYHSFFACFLSFSFNRLRNYPFLMSTHTVIER